MNCHWREMVRTIASLADIDETRLPADQREELRAMRYARAVEIARQEIRRVLSTRITPMPSRDALQILIERGHGATHSELRELAFLRDEELRKINRAAHRPKAAVHRSDIGAFAAWAAHSNTGLALYGRDGSSTEMAGSCCAAAAEASRAEGHAMTAQAIARRLRRLRRIERLGQKVAGKCSSLTDR